MKTYSIFGADFSVEYVNEDFVLIKDKNLGNRSVTNDAEAVVDMVLQEYPDRRIFYIDSCGFTDELCHDGEKFTDFHPGIPDEFLNLVS